MRRFLPLLLLTGGLAATLAPVLPALADDASRLAYQEALSTWWRSGAEVALDEEAYRVDGLSFEDGVCSFSVDKGIAIPVMSGVAPLSERIVGFVFTGEGKLKVNFPDKGDAQLFANHLVRRMGVKPAQAEPLAYQRAPYEVSVSRALILSADPKVEKLLYGRSPLGTGTVLTEKDGEVDATIEVNASRGKLPAMLVATNLLPQRRLQLERTGLDPIAAIRQDRLLHEELGLPGDDLRLYAEFRTEENFRVVNLLGATVGPNDNDQWMSCFRDGSGYTDSGYRSMAFVHGTDFEDKRHFQRVSGERFTGETLTATPHPRRWLEPVDAVTEIEVRPTPAKNYQLPTVASTLTLRAQGGPIQHVALRLPSGGAINGTFEVEGVTLPDGTPLAWVWLNADLNSSKRVIAQENNATGELPGTADADAEVIPDEPETDSTSSVSSRSVTMETREAITYDSALADMLAVDENAPDSANYVQTSYRREAMVILPRPVPAGETVTFTLRWTAKWLYANWSEQGQSLGPTTGIQNYLPELLPAFGGTIWNLTTRLRVPTAGRRVGVALSGSTVSDAINDDDGWRTIEVRAVGARQPGVAIGRWSEKDESPHQELPGVNVHMFSSTDLPAFGPEVRRVVSWLNRFLPNFPYNELDVYQGASTFVSNVSYQGRQDAAFGMVGVQTVKITDIGENASITQEDPNYTQTMIARQVAGQLWGQAIGPATGREEWLVQALSDVYAAFYIRAGLGIKAYEERIKGLRKSLEDPVERTRGYKLLADDTRPMAPAGATAFSDYSPKARADYAFYVLAETLRFQIGDTAFFAGLELLAEQQWGKGVTTEQLQAAFEQTSRTDLDDFFATYIHTGYMPALNLDYRVTPEGRVEGCMKADVPFGRFVVPVRFVDRDGKREDWMAMQVVDGIARFQTPPREGKIKIDIDPLGIVLATKRAVNQVADPKCE